MQLEFGTGLLSCMKIGLIPEDLKFEVVELSLTFLSFYSKVLHSRWLPVFQFGLPQIPTAALRNKLIPELMLLSDFTQKSMTRQISCHLLGTLAGVLGKEFKGPLLQRAKALSQDTSPEVREEMSKAWLEIMRAVGKPVLEEAIFFDILKLLDDEVEVIKCNGMALLIKSLEMMSEAFFHKEVSALLPNLVFNNSSLKIDEVISENLGLLVLGCRGVHRPENIKLVKKLLAASPAIRKNVAFNFPAVVKFLNLCNEVREMLTLLSNDPDSAVRSTFASGFHEILSLNRQCKLLPKLAAKLLEDSETRPSAFKRLKSWSSLMDPSQLLMKFIKLLTQPLDWRSQCLFLQQFSECFENFNTKELLDHLVPLLLHKMLTACWPVKVSCCGLLSQLIHSTFYLSRKLDICNIVKEKLAYSGSCFDRMLFIEFAEHMARLHSKKFFLKHFFEEYLGMATDPIHSVQVKFLMSAPSVGLLTGSEQILRAMQEANYAGTTCKYLCEQAISCYKSKLFQEKTAGEVLARDRSKELFEQQQEIMEVRELEGSKRKTVDELVLKSTAERPQKGRKVTVKGRLQSESIEPKPRGTRSTAVIKPMISVKKK